VYLETDTRYTAPDGMATEHVVSQFMGWLTRMMKPERVIETGCYIGSTTLEIGQALKENGSGTL
jgi:predicted O-methyltransferase YrrM